jgi:predicted RNA-binding protein YlxR (DUF448 family)
MPRQKHKPQRTCIVCRENKEKRELIRVVRTPEKRVVIDPTGKANGRGAYLCRQSDCQDKGLQKGRLDRALKVTLSEADLAVLRSALQTERAKT